jgi:putative component of membrane protein insertase Oxa1/YidC/SpoIIIJ protein YidD
MRLGLVAQIMLGFEPGSGLVQMTAIKRNKDSLNPLRNYTCTYTYSCPSYARDTVGL